MSEDKSKKHNSSATHQRTQRSSTLNRKYVHRPEAHRKAPKAQNIVLDSADLSEEMDSGFAPEISSFAICQAENMRRRQELADKINRERLSALKQKRVQVAAPTEVEPVHLADLKETGKTKVHKPEIASRAMVVKAPQPAKRPQPSIQQETASPKQLKDEAIQKAMRSVATMDAKTEKTARAARKSRHNKRVTKRVALGVACAAAVVVSIGAFIALNLPNVSMGVIAMQTGIDNSHLYIPRGYSLATSSTGEDSVTMIFANADGQNYTLTEEKSSWDSKALITNYVSPKWSSYDTVKEQGLTIYIFGSSAAWVNGGVKYTIDAPSGTLTNKQIKNIATSL